MTRGERIQRSNVTIQWFGREVHRNINIGMRSRVRLAAQLLRDRVVINISRPVTKLPGGRVDPGSRSDPGEFPEADTTRLMKDIFWESVGDLEANVGTTLDYGLILETRMDRSFLRRTLNEQRSMIQRILTRWTKIAWTRVMADTRELDVRRRDCPMLGSVWARFVIPRRVACWQ